MTSWDGHQFDERIGDYDQAGQALGREVFTAITRSARGYSGYDGLLDYDLSDAQVHAQATGRGPLVRHILSVVADNGARSEPPNQHPATDAAVVLTVTG